MLYGQNPVSVVSLPVLDLLIRPDEHESSTAPSRVDTMIDQAAAWGQDFPFLQGDRSPSRSVEVILRQWDAERDRPRTCRSRAFSPMESKRSGPMNARPCPVFRVLSETLFKTRRLGVGFKNCTTRVSAGCPCNRSSCRLLRESLHRGRDGPAS